MEQFIKDDFKENFDRLMSFFRAFGIFIILYWFLYNFDFKNRILRIVYVLSMTLYLVSFIFKGISLLDNTIENCYRFYSYKKKISEM